MSFNSIQYIALLAFVVAAFWGMRRIPNPAGRRLRIGLLLGASYLFYGAWDWRFLGLLLISTVVDYTVARNIGATEDARRRKRLLIVSLSVNLGILGFFKYFGFFVDSFAALAETMGFPVDIPVLSIVLPVGISFYTFQTMAYTIDVYWRRLEPTRDFLAFATYVAFFPQLVAGPIERAGRLLPQLENPAQRIRKDDVASGIGLILLGLFKKVAIADALAPFVETIFSTPGEYSWLATVGGVYAFALQIYADFSGYSDIARGSARLVGVELVRNFEQPYLSRNITEFWRTWHISLSQWLRDYLYIPLGGNRKGPRRTLINLFVTMLLGGLWHGAAWTFVFWGALHGTYLAVHRMWRHRTDSAELRLPTTSEWPAVFATFNLVCFGWVFFRANGFGNAVDVLASVFTFSTGGETSAASGVFLLVAAAVAMFLIDIEQRRTGHHVPHLQRPLLRGVITGFAVVGILLFAGQPSVPFLYFQF